MTFLEMQQELESRLHAYDMTISSDLTKLKRWLNMAQQYIAGKRLWYFTLAQEIIQTVTDYTTGTVTIAAGGTTATFSGTIADSKTGQYIQFASSDDWYKITAHTAGTDTATISPAAISANTAAAYTIRKLLYTTSTPLSQIIDMKQFSSPGNLASMSPMKADYFLPLQYDTGNTTHYIVSTPSSTGAVQFSLFNSPSSVFNIMVRGTQKLTDMSSDSDTSIIPAQFHDAIINIAAYYGFQSIDDKRASEELVVGESRITAMANFHTDTGRHRIIRPVDDASVYQDPNYLTDILFWNL